MASLEESFDLTRMRALKVYGALEWELAHLLCALLDTTPAKANLIFYRVVNTRARHGIISDLIAIECAEFKRFWGRLEDLLQSVDTQRNQVTHWLTLLDAAGAEFRLENPVSLMRDLPGSIRYGTDELDAFRNECGQFAWIVSSFTSYLQCPEPTLVPPALIEIFLEPPENLNRPAFRQALFDAAQIGPRPPLRV
jgi:hypothetical protein